MVEKILAYERAAASVRDLRILAWGGAPGYGGAIDSMASTLLTTMVRTKSPAWCDAWLLSGDRDNALCGWPPDQPTVFGSDPEIEVITRSSTADGPDPEVGPITITSPKFQPVEEEADI